VTYTLHGADSMEITHCSGDDVEHVKLKPGKAKACKWKPVEPLTEPPAQPAGRELRGLTRTD
jgi:hypothetical protein